jgi:hypothetical protein
MALMVQEGAIYEAREDRKAAHWRVVETVEKIVDERRRGRGKQYLVRWEGYGPEFDRWVPGKEMEDTTALDVWQQ